MKKIRISERTHLRMVFPSRNEDVSFLLLFFKIETFYNFNIKEDSSLINKIHLFHLSLTFSFQDSLNLDDKLKGNDMENETDDTVEPREEILLVQISDIESDQGSNVGDPISKENQSSDDAFFKDQSKLKNLILKIYSILTKIFLYFQFS